MKEAFVAVGKLAAHDSFGEVSCVTSEPMPYSIVTNTAVELCVVEPEKLAGRCAHNVLVNSHESLKNKPHSVKVYFTLKSIEYLQMWMR